MDCGEKEIVTRNNICYRTIIVDVQNVDAWLLFVSKFLSKKNEKICTIMDYNGK